MRLPDVPDVPEGGSVDALPGLCQEARWLIGFWLNRGSSTPKKTRTRYSSEEGDAQLVWGERARARIAAQVESIRHWTIREGSYASCEGSYATWFVDPPYQAMGKYYKVRLAPEDYPPAGHVVPITRGRGHRLRAARRRLAPVHAARHDQEPAGRFRRGRVDPACERVNPARPPRVYVSMAHPRSPRSPADLAFAALQKKLFRLHTVDVTRMEILRRMETPSYTVACGVWRAVWSELDMEIRNPEPDWTRVRKLHAVWLAAERWKAAMRPTTPAASRDAPTFGVSGVDAFAELPDGPAVPAFTFDPDPTTCLLGDHAALGLLPPTETRDGGHTPCESILGSRVT